MGEQKEKATRILSYGLVVMALTHVLTHVFGGIHTSIFSLLRDEFHLTLRQLGVIAAIPPLCQALLAIPTGLLSDRVGAKKMIILSFVFATLGAVLASQATTPMVFILAVSMVYVNTTIYHPASYSFTTRLFTGKERPKAMGIHGAGGALGHAMGPLAVSILIGLLAFQWRQVYLLLAAPMVLGVLMVLFIKEEPREEVEEESSQASGGEGFRSLLNFSMLMFLTYSALRMMGGSMISSFLVLYLQDTRGLDIATASFVQSGTTLSGMLAAPIGGFMAARFGEKRWLWSSFAVGVVSLGVSIIYPSVTWFVVFYLIYGFCNTLGMASRSSIMAGLSPSRQRGLGYALFFLPGSIMGAVAPIVAGYIAESYGFGTIFYLALGIYALALGILKFMVKVD